MTADIFDDYIPQILKNKDTLKDNIDTNNINTTQENNYTIKKIFTPQINIHTNDTFGAVAKLNGYTQTLYSAKDLINVADQKTNDGYTLQGLIGERFLSILLTSFLGTLEKNNSTMNNQIYWGVLREKYSHIGKGFIACYNNKYLLRHKDEFNFVILEKDESVNPKEMYMQEKYGLLSTEIDGLGYLHTKDKYYLIIGESTTKNNFSITSFGEHKRNYEDRIFTPLKSLFPNHELIYLVMAPEEQLYNYKEKETVLKNKPLEIYKKLEDINIRSMFVPLPKTQPSLDMMVENFTKNIPLAKSLLHSK